MRKVNSDEVATFVCDNAEQIIEKVITSDEVLSDEALQRVFNKIYDRAIKPKIK